MDPVIQYYDNLAKDYDEERFQNSYGAFIDTQERYFLDRLIEPYHQEILEIACGTGRLTNYATIGVDGSEEMLKHARAKYPAKSFYQSDASNLPFKNESQDLIYAFHFFMHLDHAKAMAVLAECARVLKPGGTLIFDIPSKKRRQLLNYKAKNWHGAFSLSQKELQNLNLALELVNVNGLLALPIHRFPSRIRPYFLGLDRVLGSSPLKEFSSYLIAVFQKQ